jgi:hypothetical protein
MLWGLTTAAANAGPAYRTDDPEPTPLGHYEFYTFSTPTLVRDGAQAANTSEGQDSTGFNFGAIFTMSMNTTISCSRPVEVKTPTRQMISPGA